MASSRGLDTVTRSTAAWSTSSCCRVRLALRSGRRPWAKRCSMAARLGSRAKDLGTKEMKLSRSAKASSSSGERASTSER